MSTFTSGADDVRLANDDDLTALLAILGGPSPWQSYIQFNLMIAEDKDLRKGLRMNSSAAFKVESETDFRGDTQSLDTLPPGTAGVTDKRTGKAFFEGHGQRSETTYLLAALHECVHLISDPASQGTRYSTAHYHLGSGLLEGLVEAVTEDILVAQTIPLPQDGLRGHLKRLEVVRVMLGMTDNASLGRLLFRGNPQFVDDMRSRYSFRTWESIKLLTSANRSDDAIKFLTHPPKPGHP